MAEEKSKDKKAKYDIVTREVKRYNREIGAFYDITDDEFQSITNAADEGKESLVWLSSWSSIGITSFLSFLTIFHSNVDVIIKAINGSIILSSLGFVYYFYGKYKKQKPSIVNIIEDIKKKNLEGKR